MSDDKSTEEKASSAAEKIAESCAHDEATAKLHAEAKELGITPAALTALRLTRSQVTP